MVRRTHDYADGGKIVADHIEDYHSTSYRYPKPSFMGAVKDRIKGAFTGGAAGKAAKTMAGGEGTKSLRQKQIEDAGG